MKTELENNYTVLIEESPGRHSMNHVMIDNYSKVRKKLKTTNKFITFNMVYRGKLHSATFPKKKIISIYPYILKGI